MPGSPQTRHSDAATPPLGFYDHHRQSYGHMPLRSDHKSVVGEFMVGGFTSEDDPRGEFAIELYDFSSPHQDPPRPLSPRVQAFTDSFDSLRDALAAGLLDALEKNKIHGRDDLTAVLLGCGFKDTSDRTVEEGPKKVCPCCDRALPEPTA